MNNIVKINAGSINKSLRLIVESGRRQKLSVVRYVAALGY